MSPRVGIIVALLAAALLAISIATSAWWSGHPTLDGKPFLRKTANIGLITANQCNFADDEETECQHLSVGGSYATTKWIQLGATGLLALSLLLFAITRKRGFGKLVMLAAALAAVMSVVLLVTGPNLKTGKAESMPLGYGFFLFFGGTALAIVSGVLAMLPPKKRSSFRTQLPSQMAAQQPPPQQHPGFDMQALLAEGDAVRPSSLGPEPFMSRPHSPGGALPGPAGPLVPPPGPQPQPLFQSAPQLRPLYEATGASLPMPAPPVQFPSRGPTPMPHAAVSAALGLDTPPPAGPKMTAPMPAPAPPKLPPPSRSKPASVAPPIPSLSRPATRPPPPATRPPPIQQPPAPIGQPTRMSAVPPPPMLPRPQEPEDPSDLMQTSNFEDNALSTGDSTSPNVPIDEYRADADADADEDLLQTAAREKVDHTDPQVDEVPRSSMTEVELANPPARKSVSSTDVEFDPPKPRPSTSVISSATPPPARRTPMPSKVLSTAPDSLPPPAELPTQGPSPACPQCEAPMAWVEQHLRFFCKSCRMYF